MPESVLLTREHAFRAAGLTLTPAAILSVATDLPPERVTNAELAERLGVTEEWIVSRTGIRERRRARPDERLSDYATRAGALALEAAEVDAANLDLVIVATLTQDELTPNTAPLVAHALGAHRAGAFDVGAACTAFLTALAQGTAQIESGRAGYVLVVGADFVTRIIDYSDKRSAPLFADAAGAVVLGPGDSGEGDRGAIGPIVLGADGSHAGTLFATIADRKIRMDGPQVFRHAVARMTEVTLDAVARAGLTLADIDLFVFHQANARITRALGERLDLDPDRVVECIETIGNASAATLPVGLATAQADGRLPGRRQRPAGRVRRRLHVGRRRGAVGRRPRWLSLARTGARWSPAPPRASARPSPRRWPPTAGAWASTTTPIRPAPTPSCPRSRLMAAVRSRSAATWPTRRSPISFSRRSSPTSAAPCSCSSTTPASRATTSPRRWTTRPGTRSSRPT